MITILSCYFFFKLLDSLRYLCFKIFLLLWKIERYSIKRSTNFLEILIFFFGLMIIVFPTEMQYPYIPIYLRPQTKVD